MDNKYGIIYTIKNKINNKLYIGQTINGFYGRYHCGNICKYSSNSHLINSINKYGIENFEIDDEFDIACSKNELDNLEVMYIKAYDVTNPQYGYNRQSGGHNGTHSAETKLIMSQHHYDTNGKNNPFYGKHHNQITKMKISKANSGRIMSYETRIKMSESHKGEKSSMYGIPKSDEIKRKLSENRLNRKRGKDNHASRRVNMLNKETKNFIMEFITISNGVNWIIENTNFKNGIFRSMIGSIVRVCKGTTKTAYGYKWEYADEGQTTISEESTVDDELPLEVQNILLK